MEDDLGDPMYNFLHMICILYKDIIYDKLILSVA